MKKSIFTLSLVSLAFVACGDNKTQTSSSSNSLYTWNTYMKEYVQPNILNENKTFDYYEIVDDKDIVYSSINMNYLNVIRYLNYEAIDYSNELYTLESNYTIENSALDIKKVEDVMIFSYFDTLTKVSKKDVYIKDYGLYESSRSFCVFSSEENCKSYLYINN